MYELQTAITIVTAPVIEPLSLEEAKLHLRLDDADDDQDGLLQSLIVAARRQIEHDTRRALLRQTLRMTLNRFPGGCDPPSKLGGLSGTILIPRPPLHVINSIVYIDGDGDSTTLSYDDYQWDSYSEPARLAPAHGLYWPETRRQLNAVNIEFVAGWTESSLPETVKHLMRLWVGHFYENREPVVTGLSVNEIPFAMMALTNALSWGDYP